MVGHRLLWKLEGYALLHCRAFAPVLIDAIREGDKLRYYVLSDVLKSEKQYCRLNLWILMEKCIAGIR